MKHFIALASVVLLAGCHSPSSPSVPSPTPPSTTPGAPATLRVLASSRADQQLDVSAQLADAKGIAIPAVDVQFTITGGTVTPAIVKTDASGTAKAIAITSGTATLSATIGVLSATATVIGGATPLSVSLSAPSVVVGATSTLTASVSGAPIGGPFVYAWTFGDGKSDTGSAGSIGHAYPGIGTYNASVKVTDGAGRAASSASVATVTDVPVVVTPTPTPTPAAALAVVINCAASAVAHSQACNVSATYGSTQVASNKISVSWDWGDGQVDPLAASPNGTRTYANAGVYTVIANVSAITTDGAKTATTAKVITVS